MAMLNSQRVSCNGFSPFQHDVGIEVSVWYLLKRPDAKYGKIITDFSVATVILFFGTISLDGMFMLLVYLVSSHNLSFVL